MQSAARRRVVVDLGATTLDPLALAAAVDLAELAEAEFAGLFIEDVNLFRLGALPFAAEIGMASGTWRPLATVDVERMLRLQAERLQRALAEAAPVLAMAWSFGVARGAPLRSLLAARADVSVVPGAARRSRVHDGPEQVLRQAFQRRHAGGKGGHGPVAVVLGEGSVSGRTLESARALARSRGAAMLALASSASGPQGKRERPDTSEMRMIHLPDLAPETLARALGNAQALFWPLPEESAEGAVEIESLRLLLECPVVLVR